MFDIERFSNKFQKHYLPLYEYLALREKFPYPKFFRSVFSLNRIEYGEIWSISPHSVRMREYVDQKNSEYGNFLYSVDSEEYSVKLHQDGVHLGMNIRCNREACLPPKKLLWKHYDCYD